MNIEERLSNLEKGYKQLCEVHDKNKHAHLLTATSIKGMNENFKEMRDLIKGQQQVNLAILKKLQQLEDKKRHLKLQQHL